MSHEPPHTHAIQSAQICAIKESHSGQLEEYSSPTAVYVPGRRVWEVDTQIDAAFPCATQASDAVLRRHALHALGLHAVVVGTPKGVFPCATRKVAAGLCLLSARTQWGSRGHSSCHAPSRSHTHPPGICSPFLQHELDLDDAQQLVQHGCKFVFEGAPLRHACVLPVCCERAELAPCVACGRPAPRYPLARRSLALTGTAARWWDKNAPQAPLSLPLLPAGANMPCTPRAVRFFEEYGVEFGPAKAVNAGVPAVLGWQNLLLCPACCSVESCLRTPAWCMCTAALSPTLRAPLLSPQAAWL